MLLFISFIILRHPPTEKCKYLKTNKKWRIIAQRIRRLTWYIRIKYWMWRSLQVIILEEPICSPTIAMLTSHHKWTPINPYLLNSPTLCVWALCPPSPTPNPSTHTIPYSHKYGAWTTRRTWTTCTLPTGHQISHHGCLPHHWWKPFPSAAGTIFSMFHIWSWHSIITDMRSITGSPSPWAELSQSSSLESSFFLSLSICCTGSSSTAKRN